MVVQAAVLVVVTIAIRSLGDKMKTYSGFEDKVIRHAYFVYIDLPSGPFRATSLDRNITIDSYLYYAVGSLGKISEYSTKSGIEVGGLKFSLTGISPTMTADVVNENTRNRLIKVGLGLLDADNHILGSVIWWFTGNIDSMTVDVGQIVSVSASASSRLINWARSVNTRFTDEDQQAAYPGDKGFSFIASLQNSQIRWGVQ